MNSNHCASVCVWQPKRRCKIGFGWFVCLAAVKRVILYTYRNKAITSIHRIKHCFNCYLHKCFTIQQKIQWIFLLNVCSSWNMCVNKFKSNEFAINLFDRSEISYRRMFERKYCKQCSQLQPLALFINTFKTTTSSAAGWNTTHFLFTLIVSKFQRILLRFQESHKNENAMNIAYKLKQNNVIPTSSYVKTAHTYKWCFAVIFQSQLFSVRTLIYN